MTTSDALLISKSPVGRFFLVHAYLARYRDRVDVRLIEVVGENLPQVIRDNTNILEHMTKDGVLDHFYELGLGLTVFNQWIARMVVQIAERYSHMNILEIGELRAYEMSNKRY